MADHRSEEGSKKSKQGQIAKALAVGEWVVHQQRA
jgi:hypothetical protein